MNVDNKFWAKNLAVLVDTTFVDFWVHRWSENIAKDTELYLIQPDWSILDCPTRICI